MGSELNNHNHGQLTAYSPTFTDKWEIDRSEIHLGDEIGSGQFGVSCETKQNVVTKTE